MVNQHDPPLDQFDLCIRLKSLLLTLTSPTKTSPSEQRTRSVGTPVLQSSDVRVNSTQAIRIKALETDVRRLLDENLGLRTELIQTKCSLARQSASSNLMESTRSAQQALEKVLLDVAGIKSGLEDGLQSGTP